MNFPSICIRGIPNETFLTEDGSIGSHLFQFTVRADRQDEWLELSINWEDDILVAEFTLQQTRQDGTLQFRAGLALLVLEEIERLNQRPMVRGLLGDERQELADNPYHGNILLRSDTVKHTRKLVEAGLALAVDKIIRRVNS